MQVLKNGGSIKTWQEKIHQLKACNQEGEIMH
jgi:hypothetical protein